MKIKYKNIESSSSCEFSLENIVGIFGDESRKNIIDRLWDILSKKIKTNEMEMSDKKKTQNDEYFLKLSRVFEEKLPENLKVEEFLKNVNDFKGLKTKGINDLQYYIELLNLQKIFGLRISDLNETQRKKIFLTSELLKDSILFFIDEINSFLDNNEIYRLFKHFNEVGKKGQIIICTFSGFSDYNFCNEIVLVKNGMFKKKFFNDLLNENESVSCVMDESTTGKIVKLSIVEDGTLKCLRKKSKDFEHLNIKNNQKEQKKFLNFLDKSSLREISDSLQITEIKNNLLKNGLIEYFDFVHNLIKGPFKEKGIGKSLNEYERITKNEEVVLDIKMDFLGHFFDKKLYEFNKKISRQKAVNILKRSFINCSRGNFFRNVLISISISVISCFFASVFNYNKLTKSLLFKYLNPLFMSLTFFSLNFIDIISSAKVHQYIIYEIQSKFYSIRTFIFAYLLARLIVNLIAMVLTTSMILIYSLVFKSLSVLFAIKNCFLIYLCLSFTDLVLAQLFETKIFDIKFFIFEKIFILIIVYIVFIGKNNIIAQCLRFIPHVNAISKLSESFLSAKIPQLNQTLGTVDTDFSNITLKKSLIFLYNLLGFFCFLSILCSLLKLIVFITSFKRKNKLK